MLTFKTWDEKEMSVSSVTGMSEEQLAALAVGTKLEFGEDELVKESEDSWKVQ